MAKLFPIIPFVFIVTRMKEANKAEIVIVNKASGILSDLNEISRHKLRFDCKFYFRQLNIFFINIFFFFFIKIEIFCFCFRHFMEVSQKMRNICYRLKLR